LILQRIKILDNLAQQATSVLGDDVKFDVIKMPLTDKDGHLTKAFQKENMTPQVNNKRTETEVIVD